MNKLTMNKLLPAFLTTIVATIVLANPVFAEAFIHYGDKGTYTLENGTYRGCLYSGGCIFLGKKYRMKNNNPEYEGVGWKKGEYTYEMIEGAIYVHKNGRLIFQDRATTNR
jgi:hypothetical protein